MRHIAAPWYPLRNANISESVHDQPGQPDCHPANHLELIAGFFISGEIGGFGCDRYNVPL
jgi:hypothetical protein